MEGSQQTYTVHSVDLRPCYNVDRQFTQVFTQTVNSVDLGRCSSRITAYWSTLALTQTTDIPLLRERESNKILRTGYGKPVAAFLSSCDALHDETVTSTDLLL